MKRKSIYPKIKWHGQIHEEARISSLCTGFFTGFGLYLCTLNKYQTIKNRNSSFFFSEWLSNTEESICVCVVRKKIKRCFSDRERHYHQTKAFLILILIWSAVLLIFVCQVTQLSRLEDLESTWKLLNQWQGSAGHAQRNGAEVSMSYRSLEAPAMS